MHEGKPFLWCQSGSDGQDIPEFCTISKPVKSIPLRLPLILSSHTHTHLGIPITPLSCGFRTKYYAFLFLPCMINVCCKVQKCRSCLRLIIDARNINYLQVRNTQFIKYTYKKQTFYNSTLCVIALVQTSKQISHLRSAKSKVTFLPLPAICCLS